MSKGPPVANARSGKVLEDVMAWVRVHGTVFFQATLRAPWGFTIPKLKNASFHFVASGQCWLEGDAIHGATKLATNDLVILPPGDRHTIRGDPNSSVRLDTLEMNERFAVLLELIGEEKQAE